MGAVARTALGWVGVWVAGDSLSERTGAAAHKQQPEPPQHCGRCCGALASTDPAGAPLSPNELTGMQICNF